MEREISVGTDIEAGLWHIKSDHYIPATEMNTPPAKGSPAPLLDNHGREVGTYHRDNILVEFQVPPATRAEEFTLNVMAGVRALSNHYANLISARLIFTPVVPFENPDMLKVADAQFMGCDKDLDAYSGGEGTTCTAEDMGIYRTPGGHIHIGGIEDFDDEQRRLTVQWMDVFLSLYYVPKEFMLTPYAMLRRRWYGQAGRYRIKPYGLEYRTPSAHWVANVEGYASRMFRAIHKSVKLGEIRERPETYGDLEGLQGIINGPVLSDERVAELSQLYLSGSVEQLEHRSFQHRSAHSVHYMEQSIAWNAVSNLEV